MSFAIQLNFPLRWYHINQFPQLPASIPQSLPLARHPATQGLFGGARDADALIDGGGRAIDKRPRDDNLNPLSRIRSDEIKIVYK